MTRRLLMSLQWLDVRAVAAASVGRSAGAAGLAGGGGGGGGGAGGGRGGGGGGGRGGGSAGRPGGPALGLGGEPLPGRWPTLVRGDRDHAVRNRQRDRRDHRQPDPCRARLRRLGQLGPLLPAADA